MEMGKKVNILLSTYNGEEYIETQINSLLEQTYENIDIYIRDDNSKDATMEIVNRMMQENTTSKNIYVLDNHGQNLGYPDCFWELLSECKEADYYSFCDQDDYWMPNKIETAVKMLGNPETAKLFFHAYEICDGNLNCNYIYKYESNKIEVNNMLFRVFAQGFSIIITDALKKEVLNSNPMKKRLPHDLWCLWVAFIKGEILFTEDVLAKYRRHENAVTTTHGSIFVKIKGAFKNELSGKSLKEVQYRFGLLLDLYRHEMNDKTRLALVRFSKENKGIKGYFSKLFYPRRVMPSIAGEIVFRMAFLLNRI